jgi:hypothetical protein
MKKRDKIIQQARERYEYAQEQWSEVYARVRDDLNFSDPTDPQQWPEEAKRERMNADGGPRPCYTFDQIGQYVRQIINTARRNKPAMRFIPVDDKSDPELAEVLQGLSRQTEYESRAGVAYINSLDSATRGGLGYFRAITEEDKNSPVQGKVCVKILRVQDFETVLPDPDFTEVDGSDMMWGFVEQSMPKSVFSKKYPKAAVIDWDDNGWFGKDHVRICEYFRVVEETKNVLIVNGQEMSEDEYWQMAQSGQMDPAIRPETSPKTTRKVEWFKISGEDVLEETVFPGEYVPIFPVIGNETWEKGKRRLGGCVRTAKDAQITYNFERNSEFEAVAVGPKAPWIAAVAAVEGHESKWRMANRGNLAYLPWNSLDENGNPVQKPERINPAGIAVGWTQLSERSRADIQASLGMFDATAGKNENSQSGRAVMALQDKADVGSYHYIDNLAQSISHLGRVLTQVWPVIYDAEQVVRILGEDDETEFVRVDPKAPRAYTKQQGMDGRAQIIINPNVGRYDVRCVVGPAFSTRQVEAAAEIGELVNGNPQLMALLGDVWVKMRNFPEADKLARRFKAMLPPQVQQAEQEEGEGPDPQQLMMALQQLQQQNQELQGALQEAQSGIAQEQAKGQTAAQIETIKGQNAQQLESIKSQMAAMLQEMKDSAAHDREELKSWTQITLQKMQPPPQLASEVSKDSAQN